MRHLSIAVAALALAVVAAPAAQAESIQSLSAEIDGVPFASDDDGIAFVPVMGSLSLSASTQGARKPLKNCCACV